MFSGGYDRIEGGDGPGIAMAEQQPLNGVAFAPMDTDTSSTSWTRSKFGGLGVVVMLLGAIVTTMSPLALLGEAPSNATMSAPKSDVKFDNRGRWILEDFDTKKAHSNFLSAIGGKWGVPTWAFLVNRGQALSSFGLTNKDGEIMPFQTAEAAYADVPTKGFRTFVKGTRQSQWYLGFWGGKSFQHMPFFPSVSSATCPESTTEAKPIRKMYTGAMDLEIEEVAWDIGLQTNVEYYSPPNENFGALIRRTTFTNLEPSPLEIEVLDGLGRLIPSGIALGQLVMMGRTMEAYMRTYNLDESKYTEPFFHISQSTGDTASVDAIVNGVYAVSFVEDETKVSKDGTYEKLPMIVDPTVVYGADTTLNNPSGFFDRSMEVMYDQAQGTTSRTPCAFAGFKHTLKPFGSVTVTSVYGFAADVDTFVKTLSPRVRKAGANGGKNYVQAKRHEADELVDSVVKNVKTTTGVPIFDKYVAQDYLDNVLRGGLPLALGGPEKPKIYHIFSRIHGDLERDYNNFQIDTTYLSQGPGNFRDVNQNRRVDVSISPYVKDFNIRMFLSFVQADGYNPLTVASTNFRLGHAAVAPVAAQLGIKKGDDAYETLNGLLTVAFRPGQLFVDMAAAGIAIPDGLDKDKFLDVLLKDAEQQPAAQFAQNGFWADHWTYTLDLVDNFLTVYPDDEERMLFDSDPLPFYAAPAIVKPRHERYSPIIDTNKGHEGGNTVSVPSAVHIIGEPDFPQKKSDAMSEVWGAPTCLADSTGASSAWQLRKDTKAPMYSTVLAKFAMLGILKFSTLDPQGLGVEMEGGKPGWNDAMNGLPGLVGSGMPETYEMMRILKYAKAVCEKYGRDVEFPQEFAEMYEKTLANLAAFNAAGDDDKDAEFKLWDKNNNAREKYRAETSIYFSGATKTLAASDLAKALGAMLQKAEAGVNRALATTDDGISPCYFYYEATSTTILPPTEITDPPQPTQVQVNSFKRHSLPLFLEGPVRQMKLLTDVESRRAVYQKTKDSEIYDKELEMFAISASLAPMGQQVGRMKAFAAGWLENQSIWLHMSFKFYLELLRGGLYEEFFAELLKGLPPFMDNDVYGRSPIEACSFIVSSVFPDKRLIGQSFLARLSGSTAEFMSMWLLMMAGPSPFQMSSDKQLQLKLEPKLPGWMFDKDGRVSFTYLGSVQVVYENPNHGNTWEMEAKGAVLQLNDGSTEKLDSAIISSEWAKKVREGDISKITISF